MILVSNIARMKVRGSKKRQLDDIFFNDSDCVATQNIISFYALPIVSFSLILIFFLGGERLRAESTEVHLNNRRNEEIKAGGKK